MLIQKNPLPMVKGFLHEKYFNYPFSASAPATISKISVVIAV